MNTVKSLAIVALLLGGTSLAMAQNSPATGGRPSVAGGAAGGPRASTTTRFAHHPISRHRGMYMQGDIHRGSKVTGSALSTRKFLNNQNSYR
jgi:hypothetical protein